MTPATFQFLERCNKAPTMEEGPHVTRAVRAGLVHKPQIPLPSGGVLTDHYTLTERGKLVFSRVLKMREARPVALSSRERERLGKTRK